MTIFGDYNSGHTRSLLIELETCNETATTNVTCKSEKEIEEWRDGMFMTLFNNQKIFLVDEVIEDPFTRYS